MNASKLLVCLAIPAFGCGVALANEGGGDSPSDSPVPVSTLTRAEVLADLQIWRESGLAALEHGDAGADPFSAGHRSAASRYLALRAAPEFALLVARIARERGERIEVAGR